MIKLLPDHDLPQLSGGDLLRRYRTINERNAHIGHDTLFDRI